MNRQKLVLCVLLLVLAVAVAYSFLRAPRQKQVATLTNKPGATVPVISGKKGAAAPNGAADDSRLHLELLDREAPRFSGYRRNIFSPIFKDETKPPPFKPLPPPPLPKALPPPPPPVPVPVPAAPAPPSEEQIADSELAKFTFLGFLKKNGDKTVFLSSNNEIFLVKKGSNLGTKFRVADVTDDAITIRSNAGGRELVIPLLDNRALSTRRAK